MAQAMHNLGRIVDAAFIQERLSLLLAARWLVRVFSPNSGPVILLEWLKKMRDQDNRPEGSYRPSASVLMQATVVTMPFGRQADCSSTTARAALHTGPAAK